MKFVTKKGAPDIPLEILEARDDDRLVLFCGAGISYQAGLQDFKGLVNQVYTSLPDKRVGAEVEAYKKELYDRVFELLERRYFSKHRSDKNLVRRKIIENLTIATNADLTTHKAILELAKTKNGKIRLVTTNVDQGFELAKPSLKELVDAAPKLPVPKLHKWHSLVHLHGIINNAVDPDGETFVFTSGDFGTAYLTERWASRFVSELFRNFTVLFIGYGINDPVIRYMTDAIAAERRKGDNHFLEPYVLAATHPKTREKDFDEWQVKGVVPILYNSGTKHTYFHRTLKQWSAYCRDGLRAKERIIRINSQSPPLPPFDDEQSRQVIETLAERSGKNTASLTGAPARIFAELDPVPPIDWLPALEKNNLLGQCVIPDQCYPVSFDPVQTNLIKPNIVTLRLWEWLIRHLESDKLIHWVIERGACLHPVLSSMIKDKLSGLRTTSSPPKEPYFTFWNIVTSDYVVCGHPMHFDSWALLKVFQESVDGIALQKVLHLLQAKIKFSKPFQWSTGIEDEGGGWPFNAEVVLSIDDDYLFGEIKKLDRYPDFFVPILFDISLALKNAMGLQQITGDATPQHDKSHWDMPSITPHDQNQRFEKWVLLIELCRDVWEAAWHCDRGLALSTLEMWKSIHFPVFRRLVFHAYTVENVLSSTDVLKYLLSDDTWWLWVVDTGREKYRLLDKIWPQLNDDGVTTLVDAIVTGPPREMYRDDLSDSDWQESRSHSIWKLLSKLLSFGRSLNAVGQATLEQISEQYPVWKLSNGERDEFSHWMGATTWGHKSDISQDQMLELQSDECVERLLEKDQEYHEGRISVFRTLCKEHQEKAYEILEWLYGHRYWYHEIWHAALVGLVETKDIQFDPVASWLSCAPKELYEQESWAVSWWTKKTSECYKAYSEEEQKFWLIFKAILKYTSQEESSVEGNVVTAAINDPVGMMAESLVSRFGCRKIDRGTGIPKGELKNCLEELLVGRGRGFILGRVILASRLHYFHAIDPEWTRVNLISRMSWQNPEEAKYLWRGYLWMPRVSADLLLDFKEDFFQTTKNIEILGRGKRSLYQLIAIILLQRSDAFSRDEQTEILQNIGSDGRAEVIRFFSRSFKEESVEEDNELFWSNRLSPILKQVWPKDAASINATTSQYLSLITIKTGKKFPESVKVLKQIVGPFAELFPVINALEESNLPEDYPGAVLQLLSMIFTVDYLHSMSNFRELLDKLVEYGTNIIDDPGYRRMDRFLQEQNL